MRFALLTCLFLLPVCAYYLLPLCLLVTGDELVPVETVVQRQMESSEVIFGLAYSNPAPHYKLRSVICRRPKVLALGTSRVLTFRASFFNRPEAFYNAGRGVHRITHPRIFLSKIPKGYEPEIIILGLDQYWFNANWDSMAKDGFGERLTEDRLWLRTLGHRAWDIHRDYWTGKLAFANLQDKPNTSFGITAKVRGEGYRSDGSYGPLQPSCRPIEGDPVSHFAPIFDRIAKNRDRFESGDQVNPKAVAELARFLDDCKDRGVHVVGFLPPYAHTVYEAMMNMGSRYQYLRDLYPRLRPVFEQRGLKLFNFSDMQDLGYSDDHAIDGFHGCQRVMHQALREMAREDVKLGRHVLVR